MGRHRLLVCSSIFWYPLDEDKIPEKDFFVDFTIDVGNDEREEDISEHDWKTRNLNLKIIEFWVNRSWIAKKCDYFDITAIITLKNIMITLSIIYYN